MKMKVLSETRRVHKIVYLHFFMYEDIFLDNGVFHHLFL